MVQSGRGIKLIVGVAKAELQKEMSRCIVGGVVTGKESVCLQNVEGIADYRDGGFPGIAATPSVGADVKADLKYSFWQVIRPETAAADKSPAILQKNRPVLDTIGLFRLDFFDESLQYLRSV